MRSWPAFYFVVKYTIDSPRFAGKAVRKQGTSRQLDLDKIKPSPVYSDPINDGGIASFLLLPHPSTPDYVLFSSLGRAPEGADYLQRLLDGWLGLEKVAKRWQPYDRVQMGIFYSTRTLGKPVFMELFEGTRFQYLDDGDRIDSIGPCTHVCKLDTELMLDQDSLSLINLTIAQHNEKRSAARVIQPATHPQASPAPPARQSSVPFGRPALLTWQVLPMGWWKSAMTSTAQDGHGASSWSLREDRLERLSFLESLGPKAWYEGSHLGERLYHVAVFDRVAVADSRE